LIDTTCDRIRKLADNADGLQGLAASSLPLMRVSGWKSWR
jgi:hypothetical protein